MKKLEGWVVDKAQSTARREAGTSMKSQVSLATKDEIAEARKKGMKSPPFDVDVMFHEVVVTDPTTGRKAFVQVPQNVDAGGDSFDNIFSNSNKDANAISASRTMVGIFPLFGPARQAMAGFGDLYGALFGSSDKPAPTGQLAKKEVLHSLKHIGLGLEGVAAFFFAFFTFGASYGADLALRGVSVALDKKDRAASQGARVVVIADGHSS